MNATIKIPAHIIETQTAERAAAEAVRTAKTRKELTAAKNAHWAIVGSTTAAICEFVNYDQQKFNEVKDALCRI